MLTMEGEILNKIKKSTVQNSKIIERYKTAVNGEGRMAGTAGDICTDCLLYLHCRNISLHMFKKDKGLNVSGRKIC
jgi:hypothetical protein